jgi:hypothetical protein
MSKEFTNITRGISHTLAAVFNNCSVFRSHWRQYHRTENSAANLEGRWIGEWTSEVNGHHGKLKCVLGKDSLGQYEACFHGSFGRMLRVCYTVALRGEPTHEGMRLAGEADLGSLAGGVYYYEGIATPTEFRCSYRCKYDQGTFQLKKID